jgi:acetoin utilization deacetylase AcuC-like enzyme
MPLHVWSSADYTFPLPDGHRFPIAKYALLRERVVVSGVVRPECVHEPGRIARGDLLLVHTTDYVDRFTAGHLTRDEERRLGLPWSPALVERSYRSSAGTLEAARWATDHGIAMNLSGGTHHAFPSHGEGYCVFNDVAVAIRVLQRDGRLSRAAIVDLDVHQGNGTHAVFAGDESVFTFSMHGGRNYPFRKVSGSRDVDLPDDTGDDEYLDILIRELPPVLASARADAVFYVAGADPYEGDRLGRLHLSMEGLARRDALVLDHCRDIGLPVVITIGGGYAADIEQIITIHCNTARIASRYA